MENVLDDFFNVFNVEILEGNIKSSRKLENIGFGGG